MGNPDTQVWVDVHTALYHCPGSELFGKTPDGKLASQRDAQQDQFGARESQKPARKISHRIFRQRASGGESPTWEGHNSSEGHDSGRRHDSGGDMTLGRGT